MKAEKVFENLEFKRGQESKRALDVGLDSQEANYWHDYNPKEPISISGNTNIIWTSPLSIPAAVKISVRRFEEGENVGKPLIIDPEIIERAKEIVANLLETDGYFSSFLIDAIFFQLA